MKKDTNNTMISSIYTISKIDDQILESLLTQVFIEGFKQGKDFRSRRFTEAQVREFAKENASMIIHNIEIMDLI